jgi:hypothetical protein
MARNQINLVGFLQDERYGRALRDSFPRIPIPKMAGLYGELVTLGANLVALHLLEDDYSAAKWTVSGHRGTSPLKHLITTFSGKGGADVAKGYPWYERDKVHISPSRFFEGVPETVWNFRVGGYQVCEKWLKDRKGLTLSKGDIEHYHRIVVALNETIRLMAEVDKAIEARGGWPGAFITSET